MSNSACVKRIDSYLLSANTEPSSADACSAQSIEKNPDEFLQRLSELDSVCRQAILEKMSLRNLYKILPVADVDLQKIVKQKVTGYWPTWFLDLIEKKDPARFEENLAKYYLAFMKLPFVLKDRDARTRLISLKTIVSGQPYDIIVAPVGERYVAYLNTGSLELGVFDTVSQKTIAKKERAQWANPTNARILKLANNTFLIAWNEMGNAKRPINGLIWKWDAKDGLQMIGRKKFEHVQYSNLKEQLFRTSDDQFATLRKVNYPSRSKTQDMVSFFDIWNVNSQEVKTIEMDIGPNLNGRYDPHSVNAYLQSINSNGVSIDHNELNARTWGLGPMIDRDTRLVLGLRESRDIEISLVSKNYSKKLPFIVPQNGENGSIYIGESSIVAEHFLQKTGDIVVVKKNGSDQGIAMFNIWTMLDAYVAESQKNEKCGI